ncbi:putative ARM repeat superfamily protein [Quillaja saponaria]|uniref:ARM repeat superfamily protein n=1 Tax=Quillaja saponaria TaxID=32244 RepID=A0AAD7VIJ3_QUISA|nr:putative ARM repeat superfamily protein [Quillaja saponaria]
MEAEAGEEGLLWKSESIVSVTLARAMSTLLNARPKQLQDAISRLSFPPPPPPGNKTFTWFFGGISLVFAQFTFHGIKERYDDLLRILSTCFPLLARIVCKGSTLQAGFELPSCLSVSAADCFLAPTEALTKAEVLQNRLKSNSKAPNQSITLAPGAVGDKKVIPASKSSEISRIKKGLLSRAAFGETHLFSAKAPCCFNYALRWSRKSRLLHAKGLEQVLKWLQEINEHYGHAKDETDSKIVKSGMLLLSSCWKHYSTLLHLEDHKFSQQYKELLDHYLSGIQYFADNLAGGHADNKDNGVETRKFFVNCLCLLLGSLNSKKYESTVSEYGMQLSRILLPQLHCADEGLIVGDVSMIKTIIMNPNCSAGSGLADTAQVDAVISFLLHLLDERDGTARAVVLLIAEYCSMRKDDQCLKDVLKRLSSGNVIQRRNAIDVISELIHISSDSADVSPHLPWNDCSCSYNPSLVLPGPVGLIYSTDGSVQSSAGDAMIQVLKYHNLKADVICMLLDNLSNLSQSLDSQKTTRDKGGSELEVIKYSD